MKQRLIDLKNKIVNKTKSLYYQFKVLPTEKKIIVFSILLPLIVLIVGTIIIISDSVVQVDKKHIIRTKEEFKKELEADKKDIDNLLSEVGSGEMKERVDVINSNFDNYFEMITDSSTQINLIGAPISAPTNNETNQ